MDQPKLVNGCIPERSVCPWWDRCELRQDTCPNSFNVARRIRPFSCAAARAFAIIDERGNKMLEAMLKK